MKTIRSCCSTFVLAVLTAAAAACGGADPAPATPATAAPPAVASVPSADPAPKASAAAPAPAAPASGEAKAATPGPAPFDSLSDDKKAEVMMTKVVPNVGKEFKAHDSKKFAKFGCATCHGPQKKDDPRNVLPKLTLSNGGAEKLAKSKPEMMKFMSEKVVPAMADALGEKPYDPATKQGFGCAGCHTIN